jgi:hypothetical protein
MTPRIATVFIVALGLATPSAFVAQDSAQHTRTPDRTTNAVTTTLRFLTPRTVKLGQAVEVSLSAKNTTDKPVQFIPGQAGSWDDFEVVGPDGTTVPYIGGGVQLAVMKHQLEPGAATTLVEKLDVTDKYLISKAGEYSIRYRGCSPVSGEPSGFGPSPKMSFKVEEGALSAADDLAAHVLTVCPKGWFIGKSCRTTKEVIPRGRKPAPGAFVYLCDGYKAHLIWVWLTTVPAVESPNSAHNHVSRYIGQGRFGHLYISVGDEKAWPEAESKLRAALVPTKE